MKTTLVLLKPDAVQRGLVGELISRIEDRGIKIVAIKLIQVDEQLASALYAPHKDKPFFSGLVAFITSSPLVAMAVRGENIIQIVRSLMGATDPKDALPGSARGDLASSIGANLIHGSDSNESAARELPLFFTDQEILNYDKDIDSWVNDS